MSFDNVSARFKAARQDESEATDQKAFDHQESYRLRGKMVGVLLRDARVHASRTVQDCARLLRVDPGLVEAWEYGDAVPSLPQLELLAYYLDVPVSHFWGMETLTGTRRTRLDTHQEFMNLRQRMIGALLRQGREELGISGADLAAQTHLPLESIQQYELGELPVPMHELSVLSSALNKNIPYFLETSSQIGELLATRENWKHFNDLPEDLRQFAANPINIGFIEIALMFSQMPIDKLKRIATSMLDITGY
jgi:transcriptional regulator with XRE-family HTH domain